MSSASDLKALFQQFAGYGTREAVSEMDGARFVKTCKDCKLIGKNLTTTDVDLIFSQVKAKGARKINFSEFGAALELIARKKGCSVEQLIQQMQATEGPVTNAVKADAVKFHDDKSLYTGVYKNGGPTNVDKDNYRGLSSLLDRSPADVRGVKR